MSLYPMSYGTIVLDTWELLFEAFFTNIFSLYL